MEANSRTLGTLGARAASAARGSAALRSAGSVFVISRATVACVAILAALTLGPPGAGGLGQRNAARYDDARLTHPVGDAASRVLAPLARWDAVWYLNIADSGYRGARARSAFFPLYPLAVRAGGELAGGSRAARLVAAYAVSLAAFLGALVLLYRLAALELGRRTATPTLLLLSLFPASLFFSAPYSESLFLLVSVGAFWAARTGHWGWAGACAAAAAATRSAGVLLLIPLAVLYLIGPRKDRTERASLRRPHRLRPDALWLLLAPLGLLVYAGYLQLATGEGLSFLDVQGAWYREFAGPMGGAWDGLKAAFEGARHLLAGSTAELRYSDAGGDPTRAAWMNLMLFASLVFTLVACVGTFRRLPLAYGLYAGSALLLPLSFPVGPQPLMSLPRFVAVLFPLFMWLGLVCEERRITDWVAGAFALGLALFTAQFSTWLFIA
jgi:mannosyltransferase PIG-V